MDINPHVLRGGREMQRSLSHAFWMPHTLTTIPQGAGVDSTTISKEGDERAGGDGGQTQPNKLRMGREAAEGQRPLVLLLLRWISGTLLSSTTGERGLCFILGTLCSNCWAS